MSDLTEADLKRLDERRRLWGGGFYLSDKEWKALIAAAREGLAGRKRIEDAKQLLSVIAKAGCPVGVHADAGIARYLTATFVQKCRDWCEHTEDKQMGTKNPLTVDEADALIALAHPPTAPQERVGSFDFVDCANPPPTGTAPQEREDACPLCGLYSINSRCPRCCPPEELDAPSPSVVSEGEPLTPDYSENEALKPQKLSVGELVEALLRRIATGGVYPDPLCQLAAQALKQQADLVKNYAALYMDRCEKWSDLHTQLSEARKHIDDLNETTSRLHNLTAAQANELNDWRAKAHVPHEPN